MTAEGTLPPPDTSRRSGSNKRRRGRIIPFRVSPEESAQIERLTAGRGLSPAALLRETLLGVSPPPARRVSPDLQTIGRMLAELGQVKGELGKAGSNLNQIAHQLNINAGRDPLTGHTAAAVVAAIEDNRRAVAQLGEMWTALMELAGRRSGGEA